jgi:hypothetical protein
VDLDPSDQRGAVTRQRVPADVMRKTEGCGSEDDEQKQRQQSAHGATMGLIRRVVA